MSGGTCSPLVVFMFMSGSHLLGQGTMYMYHDIHTFHLSVCEVPEISELGVSATAFTIILGQGAGISGSMGYLSDEISA